MQKNDLQRERTGRTVLVLHNRSAGSKSRERRVLALCEALQNQDFCAECVDDRARFGELANALAKSGDLHAVIAAGGDGTVAEAVNRSPIGTPVAVYPMGTENVLARYLGYRRDTAWLVQLLMDGCRMRLDACRANGRLFLLMIGVGFDGDIVERLAKTRRGHISRFTYAKPLLAAIRRYSYPELRVYFDQGSTPGGQGSTTGGQESTTGGNREDNPNRFPITAKWVFGMNVPRYALRLQFAPGAIPTDGQLDVCTMERGSFWNGLRYFLYLLVRRHHRLADVGLQRCSSVRIESASGVPVPYQLDGDPGGHLPVEVTVEPGRFTAIVSEERARQLGAPQGQIDDEIVD